MLIAAIVGIPYMIGIVILRLPIKAFVPMDGTEPDPWLTGLASIAIGCLLWLTGTVIKAIVGF